VITKALQPVTLVANLPDIKTESDGSGLNFRNHLLAKWKKEVDDRRIR